MNRKHLMGLLLFFCGSPFLQAQQWLRTMKRLPDTGQETSYTTTPGEDADYKINPPFFIINPDGTATDTVTGLMWQRVDGPEMTVEKARIYCDTLTLGGYTDWRLPLLRESYSILNHQKTNQALDATIFPKSAAEYWWSAERQINDSNRIWVTNAGGGAGNHLKTETISAGGTRHIHVRAVRYTQQPQVLSSRFQDNGDGTATDMLTGLTWLKALQADTLSWEQALWLADSSTAAGKSDWRLPNIKELQSVSDQGLVLPCISNKLLSFVGNRKFWSSTTLPNQNTKAWYLDTRFGITTYDPKIRRNDVLLVRGNNTTSTAVVTLQPADVRVWPNPFRDRIYISHPERYTQYIITDASGRVVYSGKSLEQADFAKCAKGIYLLSASGKDFLRMKLIRE